MPFNFKIRPSDSPLVESVWHTETISNGESFMSTAESSWEMVISKHLGKYTLSIRGPEAKASVAQMPGGHTEFFGIIFKRSVFMPHLPKQNLINEAIHLPQSTKSAFTVIGGVFEIPTFENADTFVARLLRNDLLTHDQVVDDVLRGRTQELSVRSLQRRFLHVTGLTYKTIQQIERAHQALAMLQQGKPIVDVVYQAGYFDQPHLTRSLKLFSGQTPSEILNNHPVEYS
jgi:AraC-like DNA-binding protein